MREGGRADKPTEARSRARYGSARSRANARARLGSRAWSRARWRRWWARQWAARRCRSRQARCAIASWAPLQTRAARWAARSTGRCVRAFALRASSSALAYACALAVRRARMRLRPDSAHGPVPGHMRTHARAAPPHRTTITRRACTWCTSTWTTATRTTPGRSVNVALARALARPRARTRSRTRTRVCCPARKLKCAHVRSCSRARAGPFWLTRARGRCRLCALRSLRIG